MHAQGYSSACYYYAAGSGGAGSGGAAGGAGAAPSSGACDDAAEVLRRGAAIDAALTRVLTHLDRHNLKDKVGPGSGEANVAAGSSSLAQQDFSRLDAS